MYDLPVCEDSDRKKASKFRQGLLDIGFEMSNFSVYCRWFGSKEQAAPYIDKIREFAPDNGGTISILAITDKQFGNIINIVKYKNEDGKTSGLKMKKVREISKKKSPVMQQPDLFSIF
jgi:CRISPR-associated protein Cas2